VEVAEAEGEDIPLPEDLDDSSQELDDELSQPVPETEDEAPFVMGATPGDEGWSSAHPSAKRSGHRPMFQTRLRPPPQQ
jgi:hypothetical protein